MIEFCGYLAKLNENLFVIFKGLFEMLEKWAKSEIDTTNIAQKLPKLFTK